MNTKQRILATLALSAILLPACTDAAWESFAALGDEAHVVCYSGGKVTYDGWSTGKVSSAQNSDGYRFKDAKSGWLTEVSGTCVLAYGATKP